MTRTPLALLALSVPLLALTAGCKKAPDPPQGDPPGQLTLFQAFHADMELLEPVLLPMLEEAEAYEADGRTDCYRTFDLSACDVQATCTGHVDPTDVPSIAHAEVLDYPVTAVEGALLYDDWTELFPSNYVEFEVSAEEWKDEYLAGDKHFTMRQYRATMPVLTAEIAIVTNLQFRRIDDWNGSGQPLVMVRGWYPEPPLSSSDSITSTMMYSYEVLVPWEDGSKTFRLFITWSDLTIGTLSAADAWNIACGQSKASWDDFNDWLADH